MEARAAAVRRRAYLVDGGENMQQQDLADAVMAVEVSARPTGRWALGWTPEFSRGPVTVYGAARPGAIARDTPLARDAREAVEVTLPAPRAYFLLEREDGPSLMVAQRDVPLAGSVNFRDLGGYATTDGRRVRWGALFRSGHMANLSAQGLADFAALDIRTVCDFRMHEERQSEALALPGEPTLEVLGIPPGIGDRFFFHRLFASTDDPEEVRAALREMMQVLVRTGAPRLARLFEILLEAPREAVLINCSAGKERTGLASVLLLSALGVPRETIRHDFMLSRRYFPAEAEIPRVLVKYEVRKSSEEVARRLIMPLLETDESYLQSAFAAIEADHGSVEGLLSDLYGLGPAELARLRDHFTV